MSDGSCRFSVKQDTSSSIKIGITKDLNIAPNDRYSFSVTYTNDYSTNINPNRGWNTIISCKGSTAISQLAIPLTTTSAKRASVRGCNGIDDTLVINEPWRELAYADEVPILNSDGTISVTSRQTQELLTTYLGDMRGSTVGKIKEEINKAFNLSQGGIMVLSLLIDVNDFLTHIRSDSYTTINEGTKYTIILSGNHKYQKGYALGEIKDIGSMRSFYFRINNGYYEYLGESVTMDAVQKAIEEAFKKRNL